MALEFPTDQLKKPSEVEGLPNQLKRPEFGTLYAFDAAGLEPEALNAPTSVSLTLVPTDLLNSPTGLTLTQV